MPHSHAASPGPVVKRLRVGVVYGGRSGEHEISLASAAAVFANLDRQRYEPVPIRIEKDGRWLLADRPPSAASAADVIDQMRSDAARAARGGRDVFLPPQPGENTLVIIDRRPSGSDAAEAHAALTGLSLDVIFPVLHGPLGEDGSMQGLLELANVPYVGCGVLASAVGMDKAVMKTLFRAHDLRVTDWITVARRAWRADPASVAAEIARTLAYPLFVKPANLGSSVGISKVPTPNDLATAIDLAAQFDRKIVVEVAVPNAREIECAVIGDDTPEASLPGEIVSAREFYDYEAKYIDGGSRSVVPAKLTEKQASDIQGQAITAFRAIDGAGMARVDFLMARPSNKLYVNEINTIPGFTTISMFAKMWEASGVTYATVLDRVIALALDRHREKQELKISAF